MFEYVKDYGLQFNGILEEREKTDLIVFHHSEGGVKETVRSIHEYHQTEGHKGIDYNGCIEQDGGIAWGRGLLYEGGHTLNKKGLPTYGVNGRSFGVVCLGNFQENEMGQPQKEGLKTFTADLVRYFHIGSISQLVTHREIAGRDHTDCPGDNFPIDELREFIRTGGTAEPTEDPLLWRVTVENLNFRQDADKRAKVEQVLHRGDRVKLDRYIEGENWARVYANGQLGYVWLKYIGE